MALATAAAVGLITFPELLFGLDRYGPLAQLVALRPHLVAVALLLGCGVAVIARFRRGWTPVAVGLLGVSLLAAATVAPRAVPDAGAVRGDPGPGRTLAVLSFNTFEGRADVPTLARLIAQQRPDLVSLPEAGAPFRQRLTPLIKSMGYRSWSSTPSGVEDVEGVTALAAPGLGPVTARIDLGTDRPSVELSGGELGPLRFVAYHSQAPVNGKAGRWWRDLLRLPYWCAGPTPVIVAGDFNATLDHSVFRDSIRGCADAAATRGDGLVPTWGSSTSIRRFAIQIDHVLFTPGIRADSFTVLDLPGSDHRAILTRLYLEPEPDAPPER